MKEAPPRKQRFIFLALAGQKFGGGAAGALRRIQVAVFRDAPNVYGFAISSGEDTVGTSAAPRIWMGLQFRLGGTAHFTVVYL